MILYVVPTLFSERSAHENHPNFLRTLGHWPRPRVILILSIGLERPFDKIDMTLGQGQWPRLTGRTRVNQCALLLEKSVHTIKGYLNIFPHPFLLALKWKLLLNVIFHIISNSCRLIVQLGIHVPLSIGFNVSFLQWFGHFPYASNVLMGWSNQTSYMSIILFV